MKRFLPGILVVILFSCSSEIGKNEPYTIAKSEREIPIEGIIKFKNSFDWLIDFDFLDGSVIYKNRLICTGRYGGFICLDTVNFSRDTALENKMNTGFFSGLAVHQNTLFTKKNDKTFAWSDSAWIESGLKYKFNVFDINFEDEQYICHSKCGGEFGSLICWYNKKTRKTKGLFRHCLTSVLKTDSGFVITTLLRHMSTFSSVFYVSNPEKLPEVPDSLLGTQMIYANDSRFAFLLIKDSTLVKTVVPKKDYYQSRESPSEATHVTSSFSYKNRIFHFAETYSYRNQKYFICENLGDSLITRDSLLKRTGPCRTFVFGNTTLVNATNGLILIRKDSMIRIDFKTSYTGYKGPKFWHFENEHVDSLFGIKDFATTVYNEGDENGELKPGVPQWKLEFNYGKKYKIVSNSGNNMDEDYILVKNQKVKLKLPSTSLKSVFTLEGKLYFYFSDYGLLRVNDIEGFISEYRLKP